MAELYQNPILTYDIDRDRRDLEVASDIARLVPDESPFAVILMRARKVAVKSAEYRWFDYEISAWWTQVNNAAGYTDADTAIVVDDASLFAPKDVIKVPRTAEVMFVTAVDLLTNTLTVIRGYGTTTAAALNDNEYFMRMGNAMEENSNAPTPKSKQPAKEFNYTQIFRSTFDESMTDEAESKLTNESERTRLRRERAMEHRLDIERAMLFGERKEDVVNKRRMTGGLLSFLKTNVTDLSASGGTLTESTFENFCEQGFQFGSKKKLFICSPRVGSIINQFARDRIQTKSGEETYGIRMSQYMSFHGDLFIVTSRTFEKEYGGMGLMLEMDNIAYRPLQGRDTKLRTNIQANDLDGWMDEYITEAGLQVRLEKTHSVLTGVTQGA